MTELITLLLSKPETRSVEEEELLALANQQNYIPWHE